MSRTSAKSAVNSMDDIPEAVRDSTPPVTNKPLPPIPPKLLLTGLVGFLAIALVMIILFLARSSVNSSISSSPTSVTSLKATPTSPPATENLLGHFPYQQVSEAELVPITNDGRLRLRREAAAKFRQMQAAARKDGIIIVPISAFRTIAEQQYLFFAVKEQRGQVASKRAEVSAPPGYSEHHTGYAMDLGDGYAPSTNLSPNFEKTSAFQWLQKNAAYYSFELSFPRNNSQGISYEPWHWRFVGDSHSLETFYKARNLRSNQ